MEGYVVVFGMNLYGVFIGILELEIFGIFDNVIFCVDNMFIQEINEFVKYFEINMEKN